MHLLGAAKFSYKDFEPVALIATAPAVIAVTVDSPYKTYSDFVEAVKSNPEQVKVASLSEGSIWNLALKLIGTQSGVHFTAIPLTAGTPRSWRPSASMPMPFLAVFQRSCPS